jgi:hypothetical protein
MNLLDIQYVKGGVFTSLVTIMQTIRDILSLRSTIMRQSYPNERGTIGQAL